MYGKVLFQCDITQFTSRVGNNTGPRTHVIKYLILEFRSCLNLNESVNLCIIFYAINEQMDECLTFFTLMLCIKYILIKSWGNHWSMKSTIYVHHNLDQIMKLVCWIFHVIFLLISDIFISIPLLHRIYMNSAHFLSTETIL